MLKFILLMGVFLFVLNLNAQLKSVGVLYQNQINPIEEQHLGIELGNSTARTDFGFAGLASLGKPKDGYKANVHFDYLIRYWHHAYLASRWSPYLGIQYEANHIGSDEKSVMHNFGGRAGIKISYDYLIFDLGYLYTRDYSLAFGKIAFVFSVGDACSTKRIGEVNPYNILEF